MGAAYKCDICEKLVLTAASIEDREIIRVLAGKDLPRVDICWECMRKISSEVQKEIRKIRKPLEDRKAEKVKWDAEADAACKFHTKSGRNCPAADTMPSQEQCQGCIEEYRKARGETEK